MSSLPDQGLWLRAAPRHRAFVRWHQAIADRLPQLLLLAIVVALVEAGIGYYAFVRHEARLLAERESRLESVAVLESARLSQWLGQHLARAQRIANDPSFSDTVKSLLVSGERRHRDAVEYRLKQTLADHGYSEARVVIREATTILVTAAEPYAHATELRRLVHEAVELGVPRLWIGSTSAGDGSALLIAAPVHARGERLPAAVTLARPLIEVLAVGGKPMEHEPAVTLLRLAGGTVTHLAGAPVSPAATPDSIARQVINGARGRITGRDHRGVPVIAAVAEVPGTDWLTVAQTDAREVHSSIAREAGVAMAVLLSLILLATIAAYQALRARTTAALLRAQAERAQLAALVECADDAIVSTDLERRIVSWNPGAERLFGYAPGEILGRSLAVLLPDEEEAELDEVRRRIHAGETVRSADVPRRAKDGRILRVSITRSPVRDEDGRIVRIARIFRDITEQQRTAATQERFASIVESSNDAMITRDLDGRVMSWNAAAERMFGYTAAEVLGRPISLLYVPGDRRDIETTNSMLHAGHRLLPFRCTRRTRDGRALDVLATISPIRDTRGRITGASLILQDISQLRAIEAALSESEERLRAAFEQAAVGLALRALDPQEARWLRVNQKFCDMLGYSEAELLRMSSLDLTPPEDRDTAVRYNRALLDSGRGYTRRKRYLRKDGSVIWVNLSLSLVRSKDGAPLHIMSVIEDITDRIHAETKLARLTSFYAALVDTNEAIAGTHELTLLCERVCRIAVEKTGLLVAWIGLLDDATGRLAPVGAAGTAAGYVSGIVISTDPTAAEGRGVSALAAREDRPCVVDDFAASDLTGPWRERAAAHGIRSAAALPIRRGGRVRGCLNLYAAEPHFFDAALVELLQQLAFDVSAALDNLDREAERRAAELRVRESEARYRLLVRNFPNGLVMLLDTTLRCQIADGGAFKSSGIAPQTLVGKRLSEALPGLGDALEARCQSALAGHAAHATLRAFGNRDWSVDVFPVQDASAAIIGCMAIVSDITEKLAAEEKLRQLNLDLEARIADRTRELAAANQELAAANEELDAFAYSVSHDLRGTLRRLQGFTALVIDSSQDRLDPTSLRQLERVRANAEHMGALVEDLLGLSRISRHKLMRASFDLASLARSMIASLEEQHPEREVDIAVTPDLRAYGDPALVRIALGNLLENAWKFTSRQPTARIVVGRCTADGQPAFFVQDNGAGFDPRYAAKLFRAFERLHSEKEFEGTGIGLTIVQRVIARHGGRVWAEGEPGAGACFYFTLPEKGEAGPPGNLPGR